MSRMAQSWKMGCLEIKNRLVRSATDEGFATREGAVTQRLVDLDTKLARGGVGLIIAGATHISPEGKWGDNGTGMDDDALVEPLSRLCDAVHKAGGNIAAQLLHCGSTVNPVTLSKRGPLWGPSAMVDPLFGHPVAALTKNHILKTVDEYARAAARAKKAGFDAVQIHAAHGYLINQFLSPSRNFRTDNYGGRLKNRSRLLVQVYEAIRGAVGKTFPLFIKMSAYDGFPGGVEPDEAAQTASILDAMGIDAIEVSAGTPEGAKRGGWDHIRPAPFKEGSLLKYALAIKASVNCPVISVEGWRDPGKIEKTLEKIDAVSMSRPFIREPDLANRWLKGDTSPALCISCNKCLELQMGSGMACIFNLKKKKFTGKSIEINNTSIR